MTTCSHPAAGLSSSAASRGGGRTKAGPQHHPPAARSPAFSGSPPTPTHHTGRGREGHFSLASPSLPQAAGPSPSPPSQPGIPLS